MEPNKPNLKPTPLTRNPLLQFAGSLALAALFAVLVVNFGFRSYHVFGQSMEPTLSEGNLLIISKLNITWSELRGSNYMPERGEIIVFKNPYNETRLIKRVVALEDERVVIADGQTQVFNAAHPDGFDPYQQLGLENMHVEGSVNTLVPAGHIFVIGDNRSLGGSSDSRNELGTIPTEYIDGRLVLRVWPPAGVKAF